MYATYLTVYSGKFLPLYYIGYSSVKKIENGYRGSVSSLKYKTIWKRELNDNPHLFKTFILTYHDTRIDAIEKETFFQRKLNVHKNSLYINMSIQREKFVAPTRLSEDTKLKISISSKGRKQNPEWIRKRFINRRVDFSGKNNPMYGKQHTEDSKEKMRKNSLGIKHTPEAIKKMIKSRTGRKNSPETIEKMRQSALKRWERERGI